MSNLYYLLDKSIQSFSQNIGIVYKNNRISYKEMGLVVDRLANGLKLLGIQPGDRIGLSLPNVPHFILSYFALLKIGAVIVPISVYDKASEIRYQLEDSEVKGMIFWEGSRNQVKKAVQGLERCQTLVVLGKKAEAGEVRLTYLAEVNESMDRVHETKPDDTALIVYTAGTSGNPKGAELTHQNLSSNTQACVGFLKLNSTDAVVSGVPLHHPIGLTLVMGSFLSVGGRVDLLEKPEFLPTLKLITSEKPTYFVGMPFMFQEFVNHELMKDIQTGTIKYWLSCGDALKQDIRDQFETKFKGIILEGYGLTEASPMVSFNNPRSERTAGSIGLPLPGIEMKIVNDNDREIGPGQIGEIIVQGPNIMKGYLNRPEASKEALKGGWLRTGDLAKLEENGTIYIVVKKKNMIVKSGFSVYPQEVEKYIGCHPKVKEVVVVGLPDPQVGEEIYGCIVLKKNEKSTVDEIINYVKEKMAPYKCPKSVLFVLSLPKGFNGRILREKVKQVIIEQIKY